MDREISTHIEQWDVMGSKLTKSLVIVNIGILLFPRELLKAMFELYKIMCKVLLSDVYR